MLDEILAVSATPNQMRKTTRIKLPGISFSPLLMSFLIASGVDAWPQFSIVEVGHAPHEVPNFIPESIAVAGNYAYVAGGLGGLRIYDISDPAMPTDIGHTTNTFSLCHSVAIKGNFAFVAGNPSFQVYDVSVPQSPVRVSYYPTGTTTGGRSVTINESYAFVSDGSLLRVFDITNPSNPALVQTTNIGYSFQSLLLATNASYFYGTEVGIGTAFGAIDQSIPTNSFPIHAIPIHGEYLPAGFVLFEALAYIGTYPSGIRIYDLSNLAALTFLGNTRGYPVAMTKVGDYILAAEFGMHLYETSNATNLLEIGGMGQTSADTPRYNYNPSYEPRFAITSNHIFFANSYDGFRIYSIIPKLTIQHTSTNAILLSWPLPLLATGYVLEQSSDCMMPTWLTVTNPPSVSSNRNYLALPMVGTQGFYRLRVQ